MREPGAARRRHGRRGAQCQLLCQPHALTTRNRRRRGTLSDGIAGRLAVGTPITSPARTRQRFLQGRPPTFCPAWKQPGLFHFCRTFGRRDPMAHGPAGRRRSRQHAVPQRCSSTRSQFQGLGRRSRIGRNGIEQLHRREPDERLRLLNRPGPWAPRYRRPHDRGPAPRRPQGLRGQTTSAEALAAVAAVAADQRPMRLSASCHSPLLMRTSSRIARIARVRIARPLADRPHSPPRMTFSCTYVHDP